MSSAVVDTDVVSFLFKNHPIGALYEDAVAGRSLVVSFMSLAELDRWAIQSQWGATRRHWLRMYLERFVVLPYNRALCTKWAEVTVAAQAAGRRIECADAWVAATALLHGIPLITHNQAHYLGVPGLSLISHGPSA